MAHDNLMLGNSRVIRELTRRARRLLDPLARVLIVGETGTGKTRFIQAFAKTAPWQVIDAEEFLERPETTWKSIAGSSPRQRGKLFAAQGGTLVIENLHYLPRKYQSKLERLLRNSSCRLIATANESLEDLLLERKFEIPLYLLFRQNYFWIPPLRHRPEDIGPLIHHFLNVISPAISPSLDEETLTWLATKTWPGNVKELYEFTRSLSEIEMESPNRLDLITFLTHRSFPQSPLRQILARTERTHLATTLALSRSLRSAARKLGISPQSLLRLLRKHDLTHRPGPRTPKD